MEKSIFIQLCESQYINFKELCESSYVPRNYLESSYKFLDKEEN